MANMTPNQLGLNFANNLVANSLNMPDISSTVYDFSSGWNVLDWLVTRKAPARQIVGLDGVFQKPIMGTSQVIAQVLSNSLVGNQLTVNFTDPTYNDFRLYITVGDGT